MPLTHPNTHVISTAPKHPAQVLTDGRGGVELAWLLECPKLRAWGSWPKWLGHLPVRAFKP